MKVAPECIHVVVAYARKVSKHFGLLYHAIIQQFPSPAQWRKKWIYLMSSVMK